MEIRRAKAVSCIRDISEIVFCPTRRIEDVYWTVGIVETTLTGVEQGSILLSLDSYCPNRTGYEISLDGVRWLPVKNEKSVEWPLKVNWNSLRLRTVSQGNVKGPETSVLMVLEGPKEH